MKSSLLSPAEATRYSRQMALKGWGRQAQERLKSAHLLIAGAGGMAYTAALYLLASGVGGVRLVDGSKVGLADLNHHIFFRERDLSKAKATVAEHYLKDLNPFSLVESKAKTISKYNVFRLTAGCHLIVDAMNHATASLFLNQAAVRLRIPMVHARVWEMNGRLTTFWPGQGPCLACTYPEVSLGGTSALMGPIPGVLGTLQALEVLRILGGLGPALVGRQLTFKGEQFQFTEKPLRPNPLCQVCRHLEP
jgi:adenylyltransferase/sulfurtransferase